MPQMRIPSAYHRNWVEEILKNGSNQRDAKWTQSIAVGDKEFVMETKAKLGAKAIGRRGMKNVERHELKEFQSPYNRVFDPEKCSLRLKKYYHKMWLDLMISIGYTDSMFNTYSISKYFFCFLHFTSVPLKS